MSVDLALRPSVGAAVPSERAPRAARAGLVPLVPAVLALALGCWGITRQHSLWRDEAATWQVAERSASEIWQLLGHVDVVHGLYYLFMHGVFAVTGPGLVALRLPSVLAVTAAAATTAVIGRRLAGPWAGLAAGLVLALVPNIQHYAQEGRAYALVTAAVAVATWLLVRAVEADATGRRSAGAWVAYAAVLLVAALLNWFSLFVLPAHAVTALVARRRGRRGVLAHWLPSAAAVVAGALPLVLASRPQADQVSWIRPVAGSTLLGIAVMVLVGLGCARAPYVRRGTGVPTPASVALPLLAVPQAGLLLASLARPLYIDRYVLFANIGLALLIGQAVAAVLRALPVGAGRRPGGVPPVGAGPRLGRPSPVGKGLVLVGVAAVGFLALLPVERGLRTPESRVDDVLGAAGAVAAQARAGDGVVFLPAARRDTALVSPAVFTGLVDLALARGPVATGTLKGVEAAPARIRERMLARHRIVVVRDAVPVASRAVPTREATKERVLAEHFARTASTETGGRRVDVYVREH